VEKLRVGDKIFIMMREDLKLSSICAMVIGVRKRLRWNLRIGKLQAGMIGVWISRHQRYRDDGHRGLPELEPEIGANNENEKDK
jgi:hypothetical protein